MIVSTQVVNRPPRRQGTIVVLLAITLVAICGLLGLGIDIGMLAIAKTQAQQAADLAALTAARTLNGSAAATYNSSAATTNAQNILTYNRILGQSIPAAQVSLTYGSYDYSQATQLFTANYPATAGVPYTAVMSTVTSNNLPAAFSKIFGIQFLPNVTASAQAIHRPRDIGLVMDLSGSMRFGTCTGYDFYGASRTSNNPDPNVPTFGPYSSASAAMQGSTTNRTSAFDNYTISTSNITVGNSTYALTYVNNFYQNAAYASTLIRAFDSYTSANGGATWSPPAANATPQLPPTSYATTPGGDVPLFKAGSTTTYAQNVKDVMGGSTTINALWELDGYAAYSAGKPDTSGTGSVPLVWTQANYSNTGGATQPWGTPSYNTYTQGPNYYGETFFMWPPDPRTTATIAPATLKLYLNNLGIIDTTDQATLSAKWSTWIAQGPTTGLANLQQWLNNISPYGGTTAPHNGVGYPSSSTTALVTGVTSWNGTALTVANKPKIYYAVCRLFNRAYPAGTSNGAFTADWRVQFFGTNDNTKLFNSSTGSLNTPSASTYTISYSNILAWITSAPNPFPIQLRAGRIKYYGSIPTTITGTWPSYGNTDQRFWVEFIDYVLGFRQTAAGVYTDISAMAGYGSDFTWGTIAINSVPAAPQYMNYSDNPARGKLRFWFGPLAMVDYLQNYNMSLNTTNYYFMQPGDSYEAPIYTAKQAFLAAITTMQNNHPNDWFTLAPYCEPRDAISESTAAQTSVQRFNCVSCPLGTNYNYASSALVFPFSTINADGSANNTEVTPYDTDPATGAVPSANFVDVARAGGETSFAMGLMLCHNQFAVTLPSDSTLRSFTSSSPITFPTGMAGGLGRKGAQKVIIFETDGLANCSATANLVNAGTYTYYRIRYDMNNPAKSEFPSVNASTINDPTVLSQVYSLIDVLASTYGTSRNPFRLYALGFGPVFQGTDASSALSTLQTMQYHAGTQSSPSTALPSNQIITGTDAQMSANMISAFTSILQSGVQVALLK